MSLFLWCAGVSIFCAWLVLLTIDSIKSREAAIIMSRTIQTIVGILKNNDEIRDLEKKEKQK
jgi:hypothetical protein